VRGFLAILAICLVGCAQLDGARMAKRLQEPEVLVYDNGRKTATVFFDRTNDTWVLWVPGKGSKAPLGPTRPTAYEALVVAGIFDQSAVYSPSVSFKVQPSSGVVTCYVSALEACDPGDRVEVIGTHAYIRRADGTLFNPIRPN